MALDIGGDRALSRKAMKAELLDAETELQLAYAWKNNRDEKALHRLISAYMRLAISMASKFKRYGAPMSDLIQLDQIRHRCTITFKFRSHRNCQPHVSAD